MDYTKQLNSFNLDNLPDLEVAVLGALEMLSQKQLPSIELNQFKHPLVVGSGNAEATGRIIFSDSGAIYASESNVEAKLKAISDIDEVIIVSASGGKHAPIIARQAAAAHKHITLITNTPGSLVEQAVDKSLITVHVFPKNREPYTYNTSTYMSMLLGYTHEDPSAIKQFIETDLQSLNMPDFSKYNKFYLIVPPQFSGIVRMLQVKFIELFGRNIARDIETSEYVKHATTVAPSNELFISFGEINQTWGQSDQRINIPLPKSSNYVAMMAVGYYLVSQIQKAQPPYFKDNIANYCSYISAIFNETIEPIVEAGN
jgi:hypothetical protein